MERSFDTVVVGAGSGGAVIAARLSERGDHSVLLIEAGPDPEARRQGPDAWPEDLRDGRKNSMRAHDWGYWHAPTPGQINMPLPRGRVVGGSSSVNTCIALRGTPADYDEWEAMGASGWSWKECLPYFRRLERDLDVGKPGVHPEWHGTEGPIPIKRPAREELSAWALGFDEACAADGHPPCPDTNAPNATGYGVHAFNRVNGERWNVARSYLSAAVRARPTLHIRAETFVRRVLFEGKRAVGLEVESKGVASRVHARRVVLAGGVFATPGILLRSGIGPDAAVRRVGGTPIAHVPAVGARLLDHAGAGLLFAPIRPSALDFDAPIIQNVLRVRSKISGIENDLQLQSCAFFHLPWIRLPLLPLTAGIGKPRGHGFLSFDGFDPKKPPRIDSRLLEHPDDRARVVEGLMLVERLSRTRPIQRLARLVWPRPGDVRDAGRLSKVITKVSGSGYHPCGTVPMGREDDVNAATDPRGRVKGVSGLYVGDASLMPSVPTSNINLATIMIGERMGEWLREGD
jgi:choline dehydrogenase